MAVVDNAGTVGVPDHVSKWASAVSSVVAIIATLAGAAAAVGGGTERIFRQEPRLMVLSIVLLCSGFLLIASAFFFVPGASRTSSARRARLMGISLPFLLGSIIVGAFGAARAATAQEEPSITGELTLGDSPVVSGELKASGLTADARLALVVEGFTEGGDRVPLLRTAQGPNRDGSITFPFSAPLETREVTRVLVSAWRVGTSQPDCNRVETDDLDFASCLQIDIPTRALGLPRMELTRGDGGGVTGTVTALTEPNRLVVVTAFVEGEEMMIFQATYAADENGVLAADVGTIHVRRDGAVCVIAAFEGEASTDACPPAAGEAKGVAWALLPSLPAPSATPATATPTPTPEN